MDHEGIISACLEAYKRTFKNGSLFTGVVQVAQYEDSKWDFLPESNLPQDIVSVSQDSVFKSLAPICKLMSRSLMLLAELRSQAVWVLMGQVAKTLDGISIKVEHSWSSSALSMISDEDTLAATIRPTTQQLWNVFKTLLFSAVLIFQSIIDVIILQNSPHSTISSLPSSGGLASEILGSLFHLSFISSKFGGLTAEGGGFTEQKRTFFAALDILSGDSSASEALLGSLVSNSDGSSEAVRRSRAAFFLACAEQLIPVVGDHIIESSILPFAKTFLDDPSHRETFESAHSVLLAVFSNNGNRIRGSMHYGPDRRETLALRLTPFYLASLLNNSTEGRLSTEQLRLAFHSVVRSTSASGDDAAAWLCIGALLNALNLAKGQPNAAAQLHRLRLTLISLISAVNLPLLGRLFIEVDKEIMASEESQEKQESNMQGELIEEVHNEVMSRVGDAQKQVSLEWWLNLRERLGAALPEL
ncbi:hypothetical protein BS47DRAFT_1342867 [Hydnum rufescens UP504]|uniref:Uncharacterized protein n=1 Tax=Hydnum rufescens UP504 TaxID=1448309 RepID=A0A9P6AYX5_9AGAM|nr:hypothetical protein BS47DRAFT_1342867 [Hydnum rufescens UP504]